MKDILTALLGLLIAMSVSFILGRMWPCGDPGETPTPKVDTLYVRDTIRVAEPIVVTRRVVDSVLVPVTDTIRMRDTMYVWMERDQIRGEDSLSVVYASGILPHVDSVIHYTEKMVITKEIPVVEVRRARWGIGFQAGMGASRQGLSPYVGVGVTYNVLSW